MKRTSENTKVEGVITGKVPPGFKDVITMRVKNSKFGLSKAGLPMITLDLEVVEPKTVKCDLDGREYEIAGLEHMHWLMMNERSADGQKPSSNLSDLINNTLPALGFVDGIDDANPLYHEEKNPDGIKLDGICFQALVSTEDQVQRKKLANGKYEDVIDPVTKKPLSAGWRFVMQTKDILRKVDAPEPAAF